MKKRGSSLQKDDEYWAFGWARDYARKLGFTKRKQWKEYCESGNKPVYIPSDPDRIYAEEWISWRDWLGRLVFWDFIGARNFVQGLRFKSSKEWEAYGKSDEKPAYIPANPSMAYRQDWQGMDDWLGLDTPTKFEREFLPFRDAKEIVHKLGFKSSKEWEAYCHTRRRPVSIPPNPNVVYAQEWKGWRDWLGIATSDKSERSRLSDLEGALLQLHDAQSLTAGQIMILMRHAGILSKRTFLHTLRRLLSDDEAQSDEIRSHIAALEAAIDEENESISSPDMDDFEWKESSAPLIEEVIPPSSSPDEAPNLWGTDTTPTPLPRDRESEVKELRGWSAVGNLLDPSPALIQLCVTRLKTAFYRFANDLRGNLDAQAQQDLHKLIWDAAFSEYGELIEENELLQASCQRYTQDLAAALLLHRSEQMKTPRLYQLDGARFLANRLQSEEHPYGLLFDEPGMGKTLTVLWALAAAHQERFLIVAPLTVKKDVWTLTDLRTAFPDLSEDQVAPSLTSALKLPTEGPAVAILHYEELRKFDQIERLIAPRLDGSLPFDAVIFDEAHSVKSRQENKSTNSDSEQRKGAELLRRGARACIGLTATPLVNELYEPISLLHLAKQHQDKGTHLQLNSRKLRDRVDVMEYLLQDTMRRQKQQVLFEIPPRKITTISITPTSEQMGEIETFLRRGRYAVGTQLPSYRRLMMDVKLDWIEQRVKGRDRDHVSTDDGRLDSKLLILCYNRDGISQRLYSRLVKHFGAFRIAHIDGSTPIMEREQIFSRFRDVERRCPDDLTVLVGTVGTVGMGVTLFDATSEAVTPHRVIFADLPFTWAEFEQGVDRLHRIGQKYPVEIEVPLVSYGEQLTSAEGEHLASFDEWVWEIISRKQVLSDQVLDAVFDVSEYTGKAVRKAISNSLKDLERGGGPIIAPAPPEESEQSKHRHQIARYRSMPRSRVSEMFSEPNASKQFLEMNDASPSAKLAQRLVRERLAQWLDRRSIVVDLGCGSNPLRDLPCTKVTGVDRHGINGGLIGDSAETELPPHEADFVVFSLSMWGTPDDQLAYLREAKRLLRPIGRLIIVEPMQKFGDVHTWKTGVIRLGSVLDRLGMQLASMSEHLVDSGARLVTIVATNSSRYPNVPIDPHDCIYTS